MDITQIMISNSTIESNALAPGGLEIAALLFSAIGLILFVMALVILARRARSLSMAEMIFWLIFIFVVPVVGPALWILVSRKTHKTRSTMKR